MADEPCLKYELLGGDLSSILASTSATALAVSDKLLALGTAAGSIHILDFEGNQVAPLPNFYHMHRHRINPHRLTVWTPIKAPSPTSAWTAKQSGLLAAPAKVPCMCTTCTGLLNPSHCSLAAKSTCATSQGQHDQRGCPITHRAWHWTHALQAESQGSWWWAEMMDNSYCAARCVEESQACYCASPRHRVGCTCTAPLPDYVDSPLQLPSSITSLAVMIHHERTQTNANECKCTHRECTLIECTAVPSHQGVARRQNHCAARRRRSHWLCVLVRNTHCMGQPAGRAGTVVPWGCFGEG